MKAILKSSCSKRLNLNHPVWMFWICLSIVISSVLLTSCEKGVDSGESACEKDNTGCIEVRNISSLYKFDVWLDGSKIFTVKPGQSSNKSTGVGSHVVSIKYFNTTRDAYSPSYVNVSQCQTWYLTCTPVQ
ncbi:MAG: hypothetical protein HZB59_11675 [Ignavibacteriales bacterium]|nr:hypothetical protein [Ignavibacteriales bacterium]